MTTTAETLARLDEIEARAAGSADVPALVAACRELVAERGWMIAALNGESVDDADARLDPVRLALDIRACIATCGCGDGIMPDTGAACGVCHSLAENDRDRNLERVRELKARRLPLGHAYVSCADVDGACKIVGCHFDGCGQPRAAHEPQPFGWAVLCADGDTHSLTRVLQRADTIMRDLDTVGSPVATECGPHVRSPLYANPPHDQLRERLRALAQQWERRADGSALLDEPDVTLYSCVRQIEALLAEADRG